MSSPQSEVFYKVIEVIFASTLDLHPFPSFLSSTNQGACVCESNAIRTGLENLGDQAMYLTVGFKVRAMFPGRSRAFYNNITSVLTSNWFFGSYLRNLKMYHTPSSSGSKEGGDVFETLIGAMVDDRGLRFVQHWVNIGFLPFFLACGNLEDQVLANSLKLMPPPGEAPPKYPVRRVEDVPAAEDDKVQFDLEDILKTLGFEADDGPSAILFPLRTETGEAKEREHQKEVGETNKENEASHLQSLLCSSADAISTPAVTTLFYRKQLL
ncbi:hypothetical protein FB451DRAFT_1471301 [Mycena latifolia]|nr:hypothetical protein FB451DRAFT_1471301 [Mycena latifolia]